MIVFAALMPHSPLLLPSINKDRLDEVEKTRKAVERLAEDLYAARPDVIVIMSSHAKFDDTFYLNMNVDYTVDLSTFGDLATKKVFKPDLRLINRIQRDLRVKGVAVTLSTDPVLDYGAAVPLLLLTKQCPNIPIVPIAYCGRPGKDQFAFGEHLKDTLANSDRRVAVVASGDQSHALSSDAPAGFVKEGPAYDQAVMEAIKNENIVTLLNMSESFLEKAHECSHRSVLMLLGALSRMKVRPNILSYEAPFGVGYLVVNFELS